MENLLITVSGGRSSARMARHIQTSPKYKDYNKLYVFCNTGHERPETIDFLKNIVNVWGIPLNIIEGVYSNEKGVGVRHRIVDFDTLDMEGRVFSECIDELQKIKWTGVPNMAVPYCSDRLKVRPAHHFAKTIFETTKYIKAVGYRKEDLYTRTSLTEIKAKKNIIAPLVFDFHPQIGNIELNEFYDAQPFKLEIHNKLGNCELCWKKSDQNLIEIIQHGTRFVDWHINEENKHGNTFFRGDRSIKELVKLAESGEQL